MSKADVRRVLITGASGFIGARLCEVMALTSRFEPRAFIHSTGSAARCARFPIDFIIGDLCDRESVGRAMQGCQAVVHLARGSEEVMTRGLENVLRASVNEGIERFVHLSSVAVYGHNPPPESISEEAPPKRTKMEYGNQKLRQEHRVLHYGRRYGLPIVILRPPNVYGPFSYFTLGIINALRSGTLAIVDGGTNPCNLVYIDNLIEAILLALWKPGAVNEVCFVTDSDVVSWQQCIQDHARLVGVSAPRVSTAELKVSPHRNMVRDSLRALPRVLLSGEVRRLFREVPAIGSLELLLYKGFKRLSTDTQERLRQRVNGHQSVPKAGRPAIRFDANDSCIASQARSVRHSCAKAQRVLGYRAPISYQEGMALTEAWLRFSHVIASQ